MSRRTRFNNVLAITFVVCAFLHASVGLAAVLPVVTQISPMFGPATGGTVVTITGSNFVVGATTVAFGASSGTSVSCASVTQCTATSPAGSGTVSVRVTTAAGTSADTAADDFTYTAPATACTTFSPATNFTVGTNPYSVAIGDFNDDGISDLAVANNISNNVSILLGTGTGTFGAATNFTVGSGPVSVAIGDFNGDGKSDLAVANFNSNNVSILLGTGTGTFGAATNFTAGSSPRSVAIGDFNGDGISDLAVANNGSNNVSILLGTGIGTFGAATNFTVGTNPISVAIGDFNGDGKSDLAVTNQSSNNVSILLGTGTGTFGAATNFTVGSTPQSVAIGDFNGDGISDLAVANAGSNNVSILLGTGTGAFAAATNFTAGTNSNSLAIGDFNGDGRSDLAVTNGISNNVSILLGTGTGTFGAATNYTAGTQPTSVAIGDFNGDGKSDLAVANNGSNDVSILLNAGCTPVVTKISPSTGPTTGGTVVTITGSNFVAGAATIKFGAIAGTSATCSSTTQCTATSPAGSGTVSVRVTNSSGTSADTASDDFTYTAPATACTTFSPATNFTVGTQPLSVAIGDFNGDGISDLAVANQNSNNVSILLGTGTGTFGAATNFTVGTNPQSVTIGDFNGDGKLDLAVANINSANVSILLGTGTGTFGAATNFTVGTNPASVAIGDFNGDGKSDLAVANQTSNTVSILLGTGTGTFGAVTNFTVGTQPFSVAIGDFNGDGKSDLAVVNFSSNNVSILLGTGTGTFGAATNFTVGSAPLSVAIGDFNGDGKSDLAVANNGSSNVSILLGTGTGTFGAATNFTAGTGVYSLAIGDFNGDGKSDLAVANQSSSNVSILIGTGTGTFAAATNFTAGTNPRSVAIGDFNGDGKSDLAVANFTSNDVSILLNGFCPPTVTSINPTSGTNVGGAVVTITGTNFVVGATTVAFGGSAGTSVTCASITQCTATSPSGSGTVDVRVTTAGGTSATSPADQFTYFVPVPVVSSINPSTGPIAGGTVVTITGSNFVIGAATIKFSATAGTSATCSSTTQCTATSPAGTGTVSVRVTTASGTSADTAADDFTYTAPATACTTFSPATNFTVGTLPFSVATGTFNGDGIRDLAVANFNSNDISILLGTGTGTFGAATNFTAGTNPSAVAIGDFNGDGISDLAVANYNSSNVSILLGTGTGTFGAATNFAAGANPRFVAVGDFNGDGISDLAVANQGSGNVSILIGTGTGTFGAATNFTAGTGPGAVAIGDFNGDGISDLAVANYNSSNVSILLGTGAGMFGAATNIAAGTQPGALAIGDFNGDGKSDLAVANSGSNNVSILLGTGTGTFGAATNFVVGTTPLSVAIGDFNGDGISDLAVANGNSNNVSILIGTGTGTFGAATNIAAGANPGSVAIGDFNGDGKSDLAVSNSSNNVSILLNAFCPPTVTSINPNSGTSAGGTVVTITGTNFVVGATTVAFGGSAGTSVSCASITQCTATSPSGSGTVHVTVTTAGGTSATSAADQFTYFVPVPVVSSISPSTGPTAGGTVVAITGSNFVVGATTVAFGANAGTSVSCSSTTHCTATSPAGTGTVSVRVTTASGTSADTAADDFTYTAPATACTTFSPATNFATGSPYSVSVGDFNGDGISDLAVANYFSDQVSILLGTGTGTFGGATSFGTGSRPRTLAIGDFNGDGFSDLAVPNEVSNNVSILLGTGTGTFGVATNVSVGSSPLAVAIGDFNGDGKSDLAVANFSSGNVSILLGTGAGTFGAATNFAAGVQPHSVAIGDFNGDGKSDLAVANFGSGNVSILLGTGTGTFGAATNFAVGTGPRFVAIGDFNGDGISDLAVVSSTSNNVSILLGTGTGTFGAATNVAVGTDPYAVTISDLNGDGKSDLAVANQGTNNVSILLGTGTGTFGAVTNVPAGVSPRSVAMGDFNGDGRIDLAVANFSSNNVSILLNAFCPPTVTSINPNSGTNAGGTVVTITGTNFVVGATTVAFGGSAGLSVSCASITQCTATSPAGSGTVDVKVTTAGGTSATSAADQFTYSVQADLAALVSAPPSAANGSAFAYTVSIINRGGSDATAVSFSAALPPNVTFNGASPAICSGAPNLVCTIGALPNQSAAVVVLNVTANGAGAAPISVTAAGTEFDPNNANNSASASPSITAAADLRIAVSGTQSTVAGSRAIYTVTVTNNGPDVAGNVAVNVTASPGLTFSANGGACAGSFPCTIGALSSGQSATITSAWDISPTAAGSVQLTANATSSTADPNSSNNSASSTTIIGTCPAIIINVPSELISGASARASAAATAALSGGATYNWSITNGTIDSGNGTDTISFTAGTAGTATIAVNVTGTSCTLSTTALLTVKPRQTCQGTATPVVPAGGTITADAVVAFSWTAIDDASGYRLWLQDGDAPPQSLGRALDTSLTKAIPPGAHHWYVETLFDGCASHESEHRDLTILPAQDCDTHGAPQLTAPASDTAVTSATVVFSWDAVAKAIGYELWLAPAGGVPTLIRVTSDTSYTATVPLGSSEWYVRAIFDGCAATESAHRTFTYTLPPECTSQRPLLIAPAEGERLTSPVSFEWRAVPGATTYEVYVDGLLVATTTSPRAPGIPVPLDERRWRVRALLAEGCGALDSAESRFAVIAPAPSCTPLEPPLLTAPGQISSGVTARIQWTFVAGATAYVVQISNDPLFSPASTSSSTVTTRELPFTFTNESNVPVGRYVRVFAIDTECVATGSGPFSPAAVVSVLPRTGTAGAASLSDPTDVEYTLTIAAEFAGLSFTATPTAPWITVTPSSGIVPPGGQTLHAVAHTAGLPPGASTGTVLITTAAASGTRAALGNPPPVSLPITVSNIPGVTTKPKSTPPPDSLTIPAVANVKNFIVRYQSDVCVTNTSAQVIKYEINFVPTGLPGITQGQTTNVSIEPGATLALNDIVTTWFGGLTSSGTLEIRPLTESDTSTSSAPATGLANRITFASSRTFAVASSGATYGQYIPAVPYANFISKGAIISLQQIAQSDKFRTNLGLVEGSGEPVSVQVRIFDSAGTKRGDFNVDLTGGQHTQLNEVLKAHGIALDDGRIEVEVTKGEGKVTAYASVIDDETNDPLLVPPVIITDAGNSKWVVPGVADLTGGSSNWLTDVRIFNAGKDPVDLTLVFYSRSGGTATTRTISLAAGEVRQLDHVLSSFFGISQDGGALHVSSAVPARLVVTARTYNDTGQGTYGQFIPAVTPEEAVSAGSRPLQILQVEQSAQYRSNVGFAEVSGKAVTLEVSVFQPGHNDPALLEVKLAPNEFRQIDSLLTTLGLADTFNARISVRAVDGEGRATAYLSLIDTKSGDPTYVPGQ